VQKSVIYFITALLIFLSGSCATERYAVLEKKATVLTEFLTIRVAVQEGQNSHIIELPLEEYLKGVLSSEMTDSWPIEALKAQAVVSRTYAILKLLQNKGNLYDIEGTEIHQKFVYDVNNPRINSAVDATKSLVILYDGKPIEAFFHSSSGGITENCGDIFQQDLPYLRSIPDPYSRDHENVSWTFQMSEREIQASLKGILNKECNNLPLVNIEIHSRTGSGRVKEFYLVFSENKTQIIKGNVVRLALDPKVFKSLLIQDIQREEINGETVYMFAGFGYGHGVGLSQWGARIMAQLGFTYDKIILFYYRGTELGDYHMISFSE